MGSTEQGKTDGRGLGRRPFLGAAVLLCGGFVDRCRAQPVAGGNAMNAKGSTVRPMISRAGTGSGLALGGGRLLQVVADGLRVRSVETGALVLSIPSQPIIACGALPDGSLLAIERSDTETGAILVDPSGRVVRHPLRHLVFAGHRELLPDPSSAQQLYLLDPERRHVELYELVQSAGSLRFKQRIDLPQDTRCDVVALGDGSLLRSDGSELHQVGPVAADGQLPRRHLPWTFAQAVLLAQGPSKDTLWAASQQGEVRLVQVPREGAVQVVRSFQLPGPVYQLAAAQGVVAALLLEQSARSPEAKWTLVILSEQGTQRHVITPPVEPPTIPLSAAPRNRCLRVSPTHVTLGGPDQVSLWNVASGQPVPLSSSP